MRRRLTGVEMIRRDFLGTGWKFPLRVNSRGGLPFSSHEQKIDESIWILLSTAKGERVMEPDYGCGIHDYVFAPNNPGTRGAIAYEVQQALTRYEPRVDVTNLRVDAVPGQENQLLIRVDYRVRATNTKRNFVYPFYLTEP